MKISLFYEFPLPRPWSEDDEHQLFQHGLDEVEAGLKRIGVEDEALAEDDEEEEAHEGP